MDQASRRPRFKSASGRPGRGHAFAYALIVGAFATASTGVAAGTLGKDMPAADVACPASQPVFIDNGAWLRPVGHPNAAKPLHILAIGSSSTEGVGASSRDMTYPAQLEADLDNVWDIEADVVNAGVGGERIANTEKRLEAALKDSKPDLVIWQLGTNDAIGAADPTRFRALVQEGIAASRAGKADVVLLDQQYFPAIKDPARYEGFVDLVESIGAADHVPVFSRYSLMKTWAGRSPDLLRAMLAKDGFHMSDRGYGCIAQRLATDLAERWGRPVQLVRGNRAGGSAVAGQGLPAPGATPARGAPGPL